MLSTELCKGLVNYTREHPVKTVMGVAAILLTAQSMLHELTPLSPISYTPQLSEVLHLNLPPLLFIPGS